MTEQLLTLRIPPQAEPRRLDAILAEAYTFLSRTEVQELMDAGKVLLDGRAPKHHSKCRGGEEVQITLPPHEPHTAQGEDIPLDIVYEDPYLLVLNKPAGLVAHPAPGNYTGTLLNALIHHLAAAGEVAKPYLVHRLDKETSGLMIVAKMEEHQRILQKYLQKRRISREYQAIVWGRIDTPHGIIIAEVARDPHNRLRYTVVNEGGRYAETHWVRELVTPLATVLRIKLQTGRTHQIRLHMTYLKHPVIGDPTYGGREVYIKSLHPKYRELAQHYLTLIARQALHARWLSFPHPVTNEKMSFEADLPADMAALMRELAP